MPSLHDNFSQLKRRLVMGRELDHTSHEPIYYLVFPPTQTLEVKNLLSAWTSQLEQDGWQVHLFSMADEIQTILDQSPLMKIWLKQDRLHPLNWQKTNKSLTEYLIGHNDKPEENKIRSRLRDKLREISDVDNALLLVTDLEALHPYARIGAIESSLIGEFLRPTVFLYPGESTGKTFLRFLGFYKDDGNYRSVHIG